MSCAADGRLLAAGKLETGGGAPTTPAPSTAQFEVETGMVGMAVVAAGVVAMTGPPHNKGRDCGGLSVTGLQCVLSGVSRAV